MSWEQLLDIVRDTRATRDREASAPPPACPRCGEPLRESATGVLHCTFDGYRVR